MRSALLSLSCLLAALWLAAPPAAAQVRRCVDASGNSVYTDRACDSVNAVPREAPVPHAGAYASGFASRGCARSARALLDGVRGALEARDVNRLANYYHWTGTGSGAARHLMDRLEAVAKRPLVSVDLEFPAAAVEPADLGFPAPGRFQAPSSTPNADLEPAPAGPTADGAGAAAAAPVGLLVQQMSGANDAGSAQTRFQLRRNAGCWWIEL